MISLLLVPGLAHGIPEVGSLLQILQSGRYLASDRQSLAKLETTPDNAKSDETKGEPTVDEQLLESGESISKSEVNEVAMIGDAVLRAQAQAAIDAQEQLAVAAETKAHRLLDLASSARRKREFAANAESARVALREAEAEEEASTEAGQAESAARAAEAEFEAASRVVDADKALVQEATTESEAVDSAKEATQAEANALALATRLADALTKSALADTDASNEIMTESTDAVEVVAESDQEMTIEQPSASQDSEESSDNIQPLSDAVDPEAASFVREDVGTDLNLGADANTDAKTPPIVEVEEPRAHRRGRAASGSRSNDTLCSRCSTNPFCPGARR